jgi:long-chain fatty acid transport protein
MKRLHVTALLAGCAMLAALEPALAGGYSRGTADTDLIFEEGNFNMRASVTVVMPQRGYETLTAPPALGGQTVSSTDGKYTQTYAIPSTAIKFNVTDDLRCAGTYTQPFGADSEYGPQAILFGTAADGTGTIREGFDTNEFGATCGYKFDLAKGRAWLIGGGFLQDFSYSQTVQFAGAFPIFGGGTGTLKFEDKYRPGYRIGVAYEIPEIALRAQLMYRSAIDHSPGGTSGDTFTARTADNSFQLVFPTVGAGTLPQSLELKVQSGVAPGWLAFGSVRWTDWTRSTIRSWARPRRSAGRRNSNTITRTAGR